MNIAVHLHKVIVQLYCKTQRKKYGVAYFRQHFAYYKSFKPFGGPIYDMLIYCQSLPYEHTSVKFESKYKKVSFRRMRSKNYIFDMPAFSIGPNSLTHVSVSVHLCTWYIYKPDHHSACKCPKTWWLYAISMHTADMGGHFLSYVLLGISVLVSFSIKWRRSKQRYLVESCDNSSVSMEFVRSNTSLTVSPSLSHSVQQSHHIIRLDSSIQYCMHACTKEREETECRPWYLPIQILKPIRG